MVNAFRGDVMLVLDGEAQVLRLTLGALAKLEARLEDGSMLALVERFEKAEFAASDIIELLLAGLQGGGWIGDRDSLLAASIEGGPIGAAQVAARLLAVTFSMPDSP